MWLSSHYCVAAEGETAWYAKALEWIENLFSNLSARLFGDNYVSNVENYYLEHVYSTGKTVATPEDSKFIKLVSIRFEWDSFDDVEDCPNWIIALNENEYSPESQHYLGTPLKFVVPSGFKTITSNDLKTDLRKKNVKLKADWQESQRTYAESIKINEAADPDQRVESVGALSTIDKSVFMTQELTVTYKYGKYKIDHNKVDDIIDDWIDEQVDNANNSCGCQDDTDPETEGLQAGCNCEPCTCKADADATTRSTHRRRHGHRERKTSRSPSEAP